MGQHQSIYAAELEGARLALHAVTGILALGTIDTGTLFLDNQSAARSPFDPAPSPGQTTRLALRSLALRLETERPDTTLSVQWLAGHHGVAGNEAADEVAKRATAESSDAADTAVMSGGSRRPRRRRGFLQGLSPSRASRSRPQATRASGMEERRGGRVSGTRRGTSEDLRAAT